MTRISPDTFIIINGRKKQSVYPRGPTEVPQKKSEQLHVFKKQTFGRDNGDIYFHAISKHVLKTENGANISKISTSPYYFFANSAAIKIVHIFLTIIELQSTMCTKIRRRVYTFH